MNPDKSIKMNEIVIEPPKGWLDLRLKEAWEYRELLYFLVWRDIKVKYKQTVFGAAWAIIQPVMTMIIFSIIFGKLAKLPSDGIPYPIFSYTALLPWQSFSRALSDASGSLVSNQAFVTKIYFPRLFLPAASILSGMLDFLIALVVLFGMMWYYNIPLTARVLILPVLILFTLVTCMAVAMWLSALNVKYRDVRYILPFLVQIWMYATPVAYSSTMIPEEWRSLFGLNPMAGVVEGFRWALLGQENTIIGSLIGISVATIIPLFIGGLLYFQRMEKTFSDVI
jgi:lipopolysaccharide transport system permease protein